MDAPADGQVSRSRAVNGIRHPYSGDLYEVDGDRVKVTTVSDEIGFFASDGRWLSGAKLDADMHLCGWLMAPRNAHRLVATPPSH